MDVTNADDGAVDDQLSLLDNVDKDAITINFDKELFTILFSTTSNGHLVKSKMIVPKNTSHYLQVSDTIVNNNLKAELKLQHSDYRIDNNDTSDCDTTDSDDSTAPAEFLDIDYTSDSDDSTAPELVPIDA